MRTSKKQVIAFLNERIADARDSVLNERSYSPTGRYHNAKRLSHYKYLRRLLRGGG